MGKSETQVRVEHMLRDLPDIKVRSVERWRSIVSQNMYTNVRFLHISSGTVGVIDYSGHGDPPSDLPEKTQDWMKRYDL
jgi:hypothetical protein